jgi:hypothetical protein
VVVKKANTNEKYRTSDLDHCSVDLARIVRRPLGANGISATRQTEGLVMRLRFTIRDLLWLAVVVAVCLGWWLDRGNAFRSGYKSAEADHGIRPFRNVSDLVIPAPGDAATR